MLAPTGRPLGSCDHDQVRGPRMARKGELEIVLVTDHVASTDEVRGHVRLRAAKEIDATELWVALVADADDGTDGEGDRCWRAFHEERQVLLGPTVLTAGTEQQFAFTFPMPPDPHPDVESHARSGRWTRRAKTVHKRHRVDARLDCKGLDLKDTATLVVDGAKYRKAIWG